MPHPSVPRFGGCLILCVWLGACASAPVAGAPEQYQFDNSVSAACRNNPANCAALGVKPASATSASAMAATLIGAVVVKSSGSLDAELRLRIDEALAECAMAARLEVMARYFGSRGPTHEECMEQVDTDSQGRPVTRAMRLGVEQHEVALRCAEEKLKKLKPGGFSISPRYRLDPRSGAAEYISRDVVEELLRQGRGAELRGTIEPDIVIHEGQPQRVQDVYDFKFPCVNTDKAALWRGYPKGSPHGELNQGQVYQQALGGDPARVQPHMGVLR